MRPLAIRTLFSLMALGGVLTSVQAAPPPAPAPLEVRIGYLGYRPDPGPLLSNVIPEPADAGLRGAELAITDSNTTGRFLKHSYSLEAVNAEDPEALLAGAHRLYEAGLRLMVVNAPAQELRQLAEAFPDALLMNAGSADDALRQACLPNVLHTLPSRNMLADALGQFLAARRWNRWLLIVGSTPEDQAYAAALKRSAKRFGHRIVAEKPGRSITISAARRRRKCRCSPKPPSTTWCWWPTNVATSASTCPTRPGIRGRWPVPRA